MAGGKFAAFKQLTPDRSISNSIRADETLALKSREEKRLIQKDKQARQDKLDARKRADAKDFQNAITKGTINKTGFKSLDQHIVEVLNGKGGVFDQLNQTLEALKTDPYNTNLIVKRNNLLNSVSNINTMNKGFVARYQNGLKGIDSGLYSKNLNKNILEDFNSTINKSNFRYNLNNDGTIYALRLGDNGETVDKNNDGLPDTISMRDILDPNKFLFQKRFDVATWLNKNAKRYGTVDTITNDSGFTKTEFKGFDPSKIDTLNADIDNLFGKDLNNLTESGKSFIADYLNIPLKDMTDNKDFENAKKAFAKRVIDKYDSVVKKTTDFTAKRLANSKSINNALKTQKLNKDRNALATNVAGLMAGDPKTVNAFNGRLGTTGKVSIKNADYRNKKLIFNVVDKSDKKNPTTKQVIIDTTEPGAEGKILSYLRYGKDKAATLDEFNKGKSDNTFKQNNATGPSDFKLSQIADAIPTDSRAAVKWLNDNNLTGFVDKGKHPGDTNSPSVLINGEGKISGKTNNEISAPNGKIYDVSKPSEMKALQDYLKSPEYRNDVSGKPKVGRFDNIK